MMIHLDDQIEDLSVVIPAIKGNSENQPFEEAVKSIPGVREVRIDSSSGRLDLVFNPVYLSRDEILQMIEALGYQIGSPLQEEPRFTVLRLEGLDCADCASKLEKRIAILEGVQEVHVNYGAAKMQVKHRAPLEQIIRAAQSLGYTARPEDDVAGPGMPASTWRSNRYALSGIMSGGLLAAAMIFDLLGAPLLPTRMLYLASILSGAFLPAQTGLSLLVNTKELDMNILMVLAATGAAAIGQYQEGAFVVFLFALGNALQAYTMNKTRRSIRSLMELSPDQALVRRSGKEYLIQVKDIEIGDIVIVRPGERIPIDGRIIKGSTAVDQSPITGESVPVDRGLGDQVFAGTMNSFGAIEVKVERHASDTTLSHIIHMVEEAQGQRAPSQQFVDRFSRYYTPAVIASAVLVATLPTLLFQQPFHKWFYEALGMLLVACPCALVISTPVSIVSAIGNAARSGVLIKGGAYLEESGQIKVMVFDKTGTLSQGRPQINGLYALDQGREEEMLQMAAAIESRSEHPLAHSILEYARENHISIPVLDSFQAIGGLGAEGTVKGSHYLVGSPRLVRQRGYSMENYDETIKDLELAGNTVIVVANHEDVMGFITVADQLRPQASDAIKALKDAGIEKTVMLTGDNPATAASFARQSGVDEFRSELLPEDKVAVIEDLLVNYEKVGMVGDGINDTPALARSTVGIAMGVAGTDAALETADIALMADDLSKLAFIVRLGRRTLHTIHQNIVFSLVVKAAILLLVIPGWLTLWLAVLGDMGTSLLVTLNGMRLLRNPTKSNVGT